VEVLNGRYLAEGELMEERCRCVRRMKKREGSKPQLYARSSDGVVKIIDPTVKECPRL
jgi:hypothetical protein